jgi:hypothetical protein
LGRTLRLTSFTASPVGRCVWREIGQLVILEPWPVGSMPCVPSASGEQGQNRFFEKRFCIGGGGMP